MTALADSLDAFTRWAKTIEARLDELEAKAKPGPSFTARAGETITIKCVIPNCEVCEAAAGKPPLSPTDEKAKLFRVTWDEVVALVREARVAQAELQKYDGSTRTYWVIDRFYAALKPFEGVE